MKLESKRQLFNEIYDWLLQAMHFESITTEELICMAADRFNFYDANGYPKKELRRLVVSARERYERDVEERANKGTPIGGFLDWD